MHRPTMLLTVLAFAGLAPATHAAPSAQAPYRVEVWSSVLFGADGRASDYRIVDEGRLPPAFAQEVKARLAAARIEPRSADGAPATFRTGVRMGFEVQPGEGGGTVRLARLDMAPLPVEQSFVKLPDEIVRAADWDGRVTAICTVGPEGRCARTEVVAAPGMPESARRWAVASFERWRFEPQQLAGRPVAGEYSLSVNLRVEGPAHEDFRQDKFLRLMRGR